MTSSSRKLQKVETRLKELIDDEEFIADVIDIVVDSFGLEKLMQQQREANQRLREKRKEDTGSTYSESAKNYYEKNKANLNRLRTEARRKARVEIV
jgi:hypothetical protein